MQTGAKRARATQGPKYTNANLRVEMYSSSVTCHPMAASPSLQHRLTRRTQDFTLEGVHVVGARPGDLVPQKLKLVKLVYNF